MVGFAVAVGETVVVRSGKDWHMVCKGLPGVLSLFFGWMCMLCRLCESAGVLRGKIIPGGNK